MKHRADDVDELPEAAENELRKRLANVAPGEGVVLVLSDPAHGTNPLKSLGSAVAARVSALTGVAHTYDPTRELVLPDDSA